MKESINTQLMLLTLAGKEIVPAQISYLYDEDAAKPPSEIKIHFNGEDYQGKGTDYLLVDTYVDLQKALPDNVKIACCMTCIHGNMCPYGNGPHQLLCTKGMEIKSKDDMIDACSIEGFYDKREVKAYGYCDDFIYQSDDYYTYNDYLYRLTRN